MEKYSLDMEHRMTDVENRSKSNTKRLDDIEKRQDNLDRFVGVIGEIKVELQYNKADLNEIKTDVKALNSKGSKRWDSVTEKITMLVVAAIVGYFLAQFGF